MKTKKDDVIKVYRFKSYKKKNIEVRGHAARCDVTDLGYVFLVMMRVCEKGKMSFIKILLHLKKERERVCSVKLKKILNKDLQK